MQPTDLVWVLITALGVRLVHIGWRARSSAEPVLGAALMTMGPGGGLIRAALLRHSPSLGIAGIVLLGVGTLAMLAFTCLVFRRHARAARAFALGLAVATIAGVVDQVSQPGLEHGHGHPSVLFVAARLLTFAWAAYEAVRYRRMYVRRAALDLADPVVANRFLLYALWTGAMALMALGTFVATLASRHGSVAWREAVLVPVRFVALIALVAVYLTFLPPHAYTRWIARRHAARREPAP